MIYYYDVQRHLICMPFSIENLHLMADNLGLKRCWFHGGKFPHYDIPKRQMNKISLKATLISPREVLGIIKSGMEAL